MPVREARDALEEYGLPNRFAPVPSSVRHDLEQFVRLLAEWQAVHNLVSPASFEEVWTRHIGDSLQLLDHAPPAYRTWVDLGSGAGFPGLILAIVNKDVPERRFLLIESNQKKAAFLRAAIRQAGLHAEAIAERIETLGVSYRGNADVVSARALAPVGVLCAYAAPLLAQPDGVLLLLKGQDFERETEVASKSWDFDMVSSASVTDPNGRVLVLRNLRPKVNP